MTEGGGQRTISRKGAKKGIIFTMKRMKNMKVKSQKSRGGRAGERKQEIC